MLIAGSAPSSRRMRCRGWDTLRRCRSIPGCARLPGRPGKAYAEADFDRGGDAMTSEARSYTYLGLAGETAGGRVVHTGLYRLADGGEEWEALANGLPEAPAVRALAIHPQRPEIV